MEALIQIGSKGLEPYRPRLRYLLIDEGRYSERELAPLRNLVAALFRLESSHSRATVDEVPATLVEWLKSPEQLERRGERLLDVDSLDRLFDPE